MNMLAIFYPTIYITLAFFSNDIARKLSLLTMLVLAFEILYQRKKKTFCILLVILLMVGYNTLAYGVKYIIHQDFYGYIILMLVFLYYSDKKNRNDVNELLSKRNIICMSVLFLLVILCSALFKNGLQFSAEWGTSIPLLYGPYELPHSLAYQLILMYLFASIGYHKYGDKLFLALMGLFSLLIVWTGVRSAFLAFVIILIFEYSSIKKTSNKMLIFMAMLAVGFYFLLFTDFLYENPIVQKSIQALSQKSGITNGRIDFNSYLSKIYINNMTLIEKLFGIGIDKLRYYMSLRYATALHAHNDVFNALVGMGGIGLVLYLKLFFDYCRINKRWICVFIPVFVLLFTNGLFMYTAFTPALVAFQVYFNELDEVKRKKNEYRYKHHCSNVQCRKNY